MDKKITGKNKKANDKLMKYCQELVMLSYAYENEFLTKDEMLIIKQDIMKSYGVRNYSI